MRIYEYTIYYIHRQVHEYFKKPQNVYGFYGADKKCKTWEIYIYTYNMQILFWPIALCVISILLFSYLYILLNR